MLFNIPDTQLQPPYAVDGDINTRYSSGAGAVGREWFAVDMCRPVLINSVTLAESPGDAFIQATAYIVQVSIDGAMWTQVAAQDMVPSGIQVLVIPFVPITARYVRVNQTGMIGLNGAKWWAIHELTIQCPTNASTVRATCPRTTPFPGAGADFCTLFEATCSSYIVDPSLSTLVGCEQTYAGWTPTQQACRTAHLCYATALANPHCYHAQGYLPTSTLGGPCP